MLAILRKGVADLVEGVGQLVANGGDGGDDDNPATRPAMRPYSMAVAPESSRAKREKMANMSMILLVEL